MPLVLLIALSSFFAALLARTEIEHFRYGSLLGHLRRLNLSDSQSPGTAIAISTSTK